MHHQGKNNKHWNKYLIMFLPVTGTLFSKKTLSEKLEKNSLDFHLDIIKKIDKLLADHNLEPPSTGTFHAPPIIPTPPPVPIEPRPPLNKILSHREIAWEPVIEQSGTITQTIPEEFKTELSNDPPFRFITSKEFIDTIMQKRSSPEDRIEIIDLNTLIEGNTYLNKKTIRAYEENYTNEKIATTSEKNPLTRDIYNNKTEVIDIQTLKQKTHENYFITPLNETEKKEKSHIYYIRSKNDNIKKQKSFFYFSGKNDNSKKPKKIEVEQSYSPIDFEERIKKLKEEQIEAEEQRKQQEQEMYKQLERERENLEERFKKLKEEQIEAEEQRKQQEQEMYKQLELEREKLREQQIKEEQRKRQEQERQRQLELEREKLRELQIKEEQRKRQEAEKLRRLELEREKLREQMIKEEQRKQQEAERLRQLEIEHERLREQQIKDEQRKQQEQEINKQLEREREKLEKLEMKKALLEQEKQEIKQTEQKIPKQIPQFSMSNRDLKKQAKEQLRLQRLEIRKTRLEERQRKKEEKQEQKIKQKHIKQWTSDTKSLELDDDIKKILLMTDTLLGELPEDVIKQFMQSEEFELYQKVLNKYNVK
jgi:hypothetical protein